jgi:hypothetical protein
LSSQGMARSWTKRAPGCGPAHSRLSSVACNRRSGKKSFSLQWSSQPRGGKIRPHLAYPHTCCTERPVRSGSSAWLSTADDPLAKHRLTSAAARCDCQVALATAVLYELAAYRSSHRLGRSPAKTFSSKLSNRGGLKSSGAVPEGLDTGRLFRSNRNECTECIMRRHFGRGPRRWRHGLPLNPTPRWSIGRQACLRQHKKE